MANVGSVLIQFKADVDDAIKNVKGLTKDLDKFGDESKSSGDKFKRYFGTALKVGFAAVAAGAAAAGAALFKAAQNAQEQAAEMGKLEDILRRVPGITDQMIRKNEQWISSMRIATGVSKTELRQGIADLTVATGDLTQAQDLANLAYDVAIGTGKGYEEILDALVEATKGDTGALEEQVLWLKRTDDSTLTLEDAVKKLTDKYGGLARKVQDRKPLERLRDIFEEIWDRVSLALQPALETFANWLASPATQRKIDKLIAKVGELADEFGDDLQGNVEGFVDYVSSNQFQRDLETLASTLNAIAGAVRAVASAIGGLIGWIRDLWGWLDSINQKWQDFLDAVNRFGGRIGLPQGPGVQSSGVPAPQLSTFSTRSTAPGQPTGQAASGPRVVSDDQLAHAIRRLLVRADARSGRLVAVV